MTPYYFFSWSRHRRDLHSFPTRRSSDLAGYNVAPSRLYPTLGWSAVWQQRPSPANAWFSANTNSTVAQDRKSTRLNSSHMSISYAVFCLKKKTESPRLENVITRLFTMTE